MEQIATTERKLKAAISRYVKSMEKLYGVRLLEPEEASAREFSDERLSEQIAELVRNVVKCRKLSENYLDTSLAELTYSINARVNWERLEHSLEKVPPK